MGFIEKNEAVFAPTWLRKGFAVLSLKEKKDIFSPIQEVMPWLGLVRPGVVLNKDGSLMASYAFDGVDLDSVDAERKDQVAAALDHAFKSFDGKMTTWWSVIHSRSTDYPGGDFANPVSEKIDKLHKGKFISGEMFNNRHFLTILYTPDAGMDKFIEKLGFHMNHEGKNFVKSAIESAKDSLLHRNVYAFDNAEMDIRIRRFEGVLESFEGASTMLSMRRLELADYLTFLHDMANPASAGQPVRVPHGQVLDGYLPDNFLTVGKDILQFEHASGTMFAASVSIKDWPDSTHPGMLDDLLSVPGEVVVSHMFRFLNHEKSEALIKSARGHHESTMVGLAGHIKEALFKTEAAPDPGKEKLYDDANDALGALTGEGIQYGYYNMTVMAMGKTIREAEETLKSVVSIITRHGFLVIRENLNLYSAWAGTLPGQWAEQVRYGLTSVPNYSDISPVRTLFPGYSVNRYLSEQSGKLQQALTMFETRYGVPYRFNLHQGDVGHLFVVGPAGTGKSVWVNFILSQYQKYSPITVIFDKDRSCKIPTLLQDGNHIDVTNGTVPLNPFVLLKDQKHWAWLKNWVEILITSRGYQMQADDDKNLQHAIESLAAIGSSHWSLSGLAAHLNSSLSEQLRAWCRGGEWGMFFDNEEDGFDLGDMTCVEMGELLSYYPQAAGAFMEYAFYRLDQKIDGSRPCIIYVEEAWFMLSEERFMRRLDNWLRTLRKRNALVMMATQSLTEIDDSPIFSSIIDNIPTKIFLPNSQARAHRDIYIKRFGLTPSQVDEIASAIPKQQYYMVNRDHSRMLNVSFGKELIAHLRSDGRAQNTFEKLYRSGRHDWKEAYIHAMVSGIPVEELGG